MPDILVRGVSEETVKALKERATRHRRSLRQELLSILEAIARESQPKDPIQVAEAIRLRLAASGRTFSDSVPLIREDRER